MGCVGRGGRLGAASRVPQSLRNGPSNGGGVVKWLVAALAVVALSSGCANPTPKFDVHVVELYRSFTLRTMEGEPYDPADHFQPQEQDCTVQFRILPQDKRVWIDLYDGNGFTDEDRVNARRVRGLLYGNESAAPTDVDPPTGPRYYFFLPAQRLVPIGNLPTVEKYVTFAEDSVWFDRNRLESGVTERHFNYTWAPSAGDRIQVNETMTITFHGTWRDPVRLREVNEPCA
jgi:hypothetical protein